MPDMNYNNNFQMNFTQHMGNNVNQQMLQYQFMQQNMQNFNGLSDFNENQQMYVNPSNINLNMDFSNQTEMNNFNPYMMQNSINQPQQQVKK